MRLDDDEGLKVPCWPAAVASVICGALLWVTKLQPVPRVDGALFRALLPVAFFHTVGHVSACVSFSLMAISFSHVVKSSEPVRPRPPQPPPRSPKP